jgi:hypothetical protein
MSSLAARISEANRPVALKVLESLAEPRRDDDYVIDPRRPTARPAGAKTKRRSRRDKS